ncbi:MAG: ATP-binding protein [Gammaproteobacteria bacterium]|nr:ATP-binding protein [Gammaproteobacteria bacterium]
MTVSIRRRLLANLLVTIFFVSLITLILSYNDARHEVQELFDAQLAQSGRVLQALLLPELLVGPSSGLQDLLDRFTQLPDDISNQYQIEAHALGHEYERKLAFQVWDSNKKLLLRSATAPATALSAGALDPANRGFSDEVVGAYDWRVFSLWDESQQHLIQVAERYDVRDELITKISRQLITPSLISLPFLGLMIWIGIGRGLRLIQRVAEEVTRRDPGYLESMEVGPVPSEIKPLVGSLNHLFERLKKALETERQFTDDAAHELRTPLAALKTQAQVSLRATDDTERRQALRQVVTSVDRATHLVDQMLTLARLDPAITSLVREKINLHDLAADAVAQLVPVAMQKKIEIAITGAEDTVVFVEPVSVSILIRNLADNAIGYTPPQGEVVVNIEQQPGGQVILSVTDSGPGIEPALQGRVFDRFYRVSGNSTPGCGLGLSIVKRVADLNGLRVDLKNRENGNGLIASVYFDNGAALNHGAS